MATLADKSRGGDSQNIHYDAIFRYPDAIENGGIESHELRKYPDHSFAEWRNLQKIRVLTWRELASVQPGLERGEEYDIECQDNIDPRSPEIRKYSEMDYQLWQLPYGKFYFHQKTQHRLFYRDQKNQHRLPDTGDKSSHRMDLGDVDIIRNAWRKKKEAWDQYVSDTDRDDLQDEWNGKYMPTESEVKMLLAELEMLK
jgi:hypothetical protein